MSFKLYSILFFCFFGVKTFCQNSNGLTNNYISEKSFFSEKNYSNDSYEEKLNRKYADTLIRIDYKTGTEVRCKNHYFYDYSNKNEFKIINKDSTKTDIWVKFFRIDEKYGHFVDRECFVKYNETWTVKNLKKGIYKIAIKHGNIWRQPLYDISCSGNFIKNANNTYIGCSKTYEVTKHSKHSYTSTNTEKTRLDFKLRKLVCE